MSRVLPGMQAAFIDIGLARTAFLHAADIARAVPAEAEGAAPPLQDIGQLVREGDDILVQVIKDPLGTKGARLTTFISLPSRFMVYMPYSSGVGVSARIEDEAERERLRARRARSRHAAPAATSCARRRGRASPEALRADMLFLQRLWEHVLAQRAASASASLVHDDLSLSLRVLRDELAADVRRVLVDSAAEQARMQAFAQTFMPEAAGRIEYYAGPRPLFDLHGVEEEIAHALERKVQLKSGGYVVFDQTEAMTTIDVNTGGYVGHRNLEETIFRTNLEAAVTIAQQLRLRNLGGIIIIDFIDMDDPAHREQVLAALQGALAGDRAQSHIAAISGAGPGRDDAQAYAREPGAPAVRALPELQRPRLPQERRDRVPRDLPRGAAAEPPVPRRADPDPRAPGGERAPAGRGGADAGRARGAGEAAHTPAVGDHVRHRAVRRRAGVSFSA